MRVVALEEHISLPDLVKQIPAEAIAKHSLTTPPDLVPTIKKVEPQLAEIGPERLNSMDENGISVQVLSVSGAGAELLSAEQGPALARQYNDALAQATTTYSKRFAAFAHSPLTNPEAAAAELERTVNTYGFKGAMINGLTQDQFLDDPKFAPLLAKAEALEVPLYLHPGIPPKTVVNAYYSNLPEKAAAVLATAGFGWHAETAIHILRLIVSGTFDRYPKLQLIIGHMGEMLPVMMARCDVMFKATDAKTSRSVSEVLKQQVYITTSGIFTNPPLQAAIATFGIDRILFSVDYPYSPNEQGKAFMDGLDLNEEDKEKLLHGNADRLLKL
ncbi:amidohydrolase [Mucilaginibacter robiniae]|uniref:Amidohydrolase n=1 Tax=Mucilaginibacter robiniae TaxID=2728022 RepID=A0A7L5E2E5_9SPHI|nr:amidohydrolase family protein [Mucilaginibacter robiniae]QJD96597.1 amidohydrolase [Mucilaginibacter robiniae]